MTLEEDLLSALSITQADAIRNIIAGKPFAYFGVIKEVVGDGIVRVVPSVIEGEDGYFEVDCVLATIASQSFAVKVIPHAGDKVRVYSPMRYSNKMFLAENNSSLIAESSRGYSIFTGIAVLENQCQTVTHKNCITVDDGSIEAKLAYDRNNGKNNAVLKIEASGKLSYENPKASFSVSEDGSFSFDNGKATITIDDSGNVSINTAGKLTFKNKSGKNLYTILKGTFGILNKTLSTFGSPANHQVTPDQFSQQEADLDALME